MWFVPQTGTKDDDKQTRKFIRRHVMLGKNQGRASTPKRPTLSGCAVFRKGDLERGIQSVIPRRVGSDLSFLEFADTVEPPLMSETLQFCAATNEELFVLEPCIAFSSTDIAATCVQSLACDALHLNAMVFGAQMYMDRIFWQTTSKLRQSSCTTVLQHYGKALHLLRQRLKSAERQQVEISDETITSVTTLAMHALVTGEVDSARNHVLGLSRLVSMKRGGVYSFKTKPKQVIEILRCDISLALGTGQAPMLFPDSSHDLVFPFPESAAPDSDQEMYPYITDGELVAIWNVLRRFCAMINEAARNGKKVSDQILLETTASVMYRLISMVVTPGSVDEAIRLATISFCAGALLSWRQLRVPLHWLQRECKQSINCLMQSQPNSLDPEVLLWCLLTYSVAFFPLRTDEHDELQLWLIRIFDQCKLATWDALKSIVDDFLWVDIVSNHPARKLVEEILVRRAAATNVLHLPC